MSNQTTPEPKDEPRSGSLDAPVGLIPKIGQAWERGEQRMEIVDISDVRVWLVVRKRFDSGEEYTWKLRKQWKEVVEKTMAVEGTKFIPANIRDHRSPAQGGQHGE